MRTSILEHASGQFADDRREFESMTRTGAGNQDLPMGRVIIEKEMLVGRVRVEADSRRLQVSIGLRHEPAQQGPHGLDFLRRHVSSDAVRVRGLALVMKGNLHAVAEVGKAVKEAVWGIFPNVNGTK